jgi:hemerythrin-like domain-containing protein
VRRCGTTLAGSALGKEANAMNAIELLETDHRKVKKLLAELDETTERGVKTREELLGKILTELFVHETIEEEIFYPALEASPKLEEIVLEGYEEHTAANTILAELAKMRPDDEMWGAKATVLKEGIEHHIKEEEEHMFPRARRVFGDDELEELGSEMADRKVDALAEFTSR